MARKNIGNRKKVLDAIIRLYGSNRCFYCDKELMDYEMEIDHYVAVWREGENDIDNYRLSCRKCNRIKNSYSFMELDEIIPEKIEKLKKELNHYEYFYKSVKREVKKEWEDVERWLEGR